MSRYRGPKLKITRRLQALPGLTTKVSQKRQPPGKPGAGKQSSNESPSKKKKTEYGIRLEEKQKLKFNYGLTERQLFRYVQEARRRTGVTGLILLQLLEMRLDSLCFTVGFAKSIAQARQLVNHGHVRVNQKVVTIPSFQCRLKDVIDIKPTPTSQALLATRLLSKTLPEHVSWDSRQKTVTVVDYCDRKDLALPVNELYVIEHYSRR